MAEETKRIAAMNIAVRGPIHMQRRTPDGRTAEWDLTFVGEGEAGATLPFIIKDRTPRTWRVQPSSNFAAGVDRVILGVENVEAAVQLMRQVYGLRAPTCEHDGELGCDVHRYADAPLALAAPPDADHWLAHRLRTFGPCPCAFVFKSAAVDRMRWLDVDALLGSRIALAPLAG